MKRWLCYLFGHRLKDWVACDNPIELVSFCGCKRCDFRFEVRTPIYDERSVHLMTEEAKHYMLAKLDYESRRLH
jgi:hypothetical protein